MAPSCCSLRASKSDTLPRRRSSIGAGIDPAQAREAGEVRVGRMQDIATLDGQGGEMGVGGQIAGCPKPREGLTQLAEVSVGRMRDMDVRQLDPRANALEHVV